EEQYASLKAASGNTQQKSAELAEQLAAEKARVTRTSEESAALKAKLQRQEQQLSELKVQKQATDTELATKSTALVKELAELKLQKEALDAHLIALNTASTGSQKKNTELAEQLAAEKARAAKTTEESAALKSK
ncbi:hypothetical protein GQM09_35260, partial [Escherichia coli]|nr:hypothetical protein [Escherichia coli]